MRPNTFIKKCLETEVKDYKAIAKRYTPFIARLRHAGDILTTEAGEFMDQLRGHTNYGQPLDKHNLKEELGDILYGVAIGCDTLGLNMEEVMDVVTRKLKKRYPHGFDPEKAKVANRDLAAERKEIEKKVAPLKMKPKGMDKLNEEMLETMPLDDISKRVVKIINALTRINTLASLAIDPKNIGSFKKTLHDLDVNSVDRIWISAVLEGEFDIEIPNEDAENWKTVQDVVDYVSKKVE